jgi:hypothetical protein
MNNQNNEEKNLKDNFLKLEDQINGYKQSIFFEN